MKEFAYGTPAQFKALEEALSEGHYYKFPDRILPECCTPNMVCIWFGKVNDGYKVCISPRIMTEEGNDDFRLLASRGEITFSSFDELVGFFGSLQPLFQSEPTDLVIDKERLSRIRRESTQERTVWPEELAGPLKKKVFGQDAVIDALSDLVVINKVRQNKRLLVIALLGPTATGKSETAKSLAEVMSDVYGENYGYIEIAGSEFIGEHTVHRFFGAPPGYVGHGEPTLLDPVRKNPYHVIVINEIEKADEKILVGLMEAIDTGFLGMSDNSKPIDLNDCVLIFTSNIPIDMREYYELSDFEKGEMCRDAFTKHCRRPEISGKIGNFLVFNPLSEEARVEILIKFIKEELDCYELVLGHVDEYLMADFLKKQTRYGARGIRGLVNNAVGRHLLRNRELLGKKGKKIALYGTVDNIRFIEMEETCHE